MMKEVREMTYSKEFKEDILSRFHASGMSMSTACKHFDDFPSACTLSRFVFEEEAGFLQPPVLDVPGRCEDRRTWESYPLETKREALRLLVDGMEPGHITKRLNIRNSASIRTWASNLSSVGELDARSRISSTPREAVMLFAQELTIAEIAERAGVAERTVRRWLDRAGVDWKRLQKRKDAGGMTRKKNDEADDGVGEWARAWGSLPDDPDERARMAEVRLAEALAVLDVLKAPGPSSLSNTEKHRAGQKARMIAPKVRIDDVLADFCIARSTYFSQGVIGRKPDKYAALRVRVRFAFKESKGRYGSQSVWAKLREGEGVPVCAADLAHGDLETPVIVSEKVIRSLMRSEGLVPVQVKSEPRRYNSYRGEVGQRPENLPLREDGTHSFHADAPGRLVVTDVTEFKLDDGKIYLSPVIDCYDGCPLSWSISTHPNDDLTASSLEKALTLLEKGCGVHTDGGANYFSRRWKGLCEDNGLVRSMSRKAKSPDNARAEGFFGTLKQEFFYARSWKGVKKSQFARLLDAYIVWYRDEKIKKALCWKTIAAHRAALADAA